MMEERHKLAEDLRRYADMVEDPKQVHGSLAIVAGIQMLAEELTDNYIAYLEEERKQQIKDLDLNPERGDT